MQPQKLYQLYDSKSETYTHATVHTARGQAIRSFSDAVNEQGNPQNMISKHPGDFTLFEIGEFDPYTGVYTLYAAKENVGNGLDFKIDHSVN